MSRVRAAPCDECVQVRLRQASKSRPISCLTRFVQATNWRERISCLDFSTPMPCDFPGFLINFQLRNSRGYSFAQCSDPTLIKKDPFIDTVRLMQGPRNLVQSLGL